MLKGTTKIELTDVVTGEKQVFEKHNMVTNAVSNIFQPTLGHLTSEEILRGYIPAYKGLLGGLFLFENTLPENVNTLFPPAGNKLMGCGRFDTTNTTANTVRGSYNQAESVYDAANKKMKFVYDFNTSQGNGTIASICLTHADAGYGSYRCDDAVNPTAAELCKSCYEAPSSYTNYKDVRIGQADMYTKATTGTGANTLLFVCDVDSDFAYYFKLVSTTNVVIYKKPMALKNISLFDNSAVTEVANITLTTSLKNNIGYCFDLKDDALYLFSTEESSNIAVNKKVYITKIAFNTWTVTQYEVTNTSGVVLSATANGSYSTGIGCRYCFVHNGYAYFRTNTSPYVVYKVQLGGNGDFVQLQGNAGTVEIAPVMAQDGYVYWHYAGGSTGSNRMYISDAESNTLYKSGVSTLSHYSYTSSGYGRGASPSVVRMRNYPMLAFTSAGTTTERTGFVYFADYLATINNLGTPITKVDTQTMKITYTIQEE